MQMSRVTGDLSVHFQNNVRLINDLDHSLVRAENEATVHGRYYSRFSEEMRHTHALLPCYNPRINRLCE